MQSLRQLIADRIRTSGPISFAEFMELSLYHPELGYYARAAQVTGRAGDFFTSVDVGALFGELLARQFAEMWRLINAGESRPFDLVEAGAGNGRLSRDVLDAAHRIDSDFYSSIRLSLVEQSPSARAAQLATLGPHAALLKQSSSALPENIRGVVFANELLDALPTHAVTMTENGLREIFVDDQDGRFVEHLQDPSSSRIAEYLSRAGAVMRQGWRAEVNLAAEDWVKNAAKALRKGFLIVIDYGHEDAELYGSSHSSGTLTTFKRHTSTSAVESANAVEAASSRAVEEAAVAQAFRPVEEAAVAQPFRAVRAQSPLQGCLQDPGGCDITSHVDLTAITRAAERSGLKVLGRLDQTYFMLGLAMEDLQETARAEQRFDPEVLRRRLALKTLLLPGGLGSTHKVLIFGKDVGTPSLKGCSYRVRLT